MESEKSTLNSIAAEFLLFGPKELIGSAYVIVYLVLGIVAVTTWIAHPNEITGLVKNLALTFVGLLIPIASAYLTG